MSKKLFKNSFIFILGDVLNKFVPFFMLPILTRYLTPEDYGIISIFTVTISILAVFVGLSVHGAINVNFFKLKKDNLKEYIGNTMIILNISMILVFILVFIFAPYIVERLKIEKEWLFIAVILAFAQFLTTINMLLWTAEQRPKPYSIYQVSQTLVTTSLSLILVVGFSMGWKGQLLAMTMSILVFSIISFTFIVKRGYLLFKVNKEYIEDALKFGIPLIPHALGNWVITGADRIMLVSLVGTMATGIYTVGYQFGLIIGVIVSAFNKAWSPYLFKILSSSPTEIEKLKIVKFTYFYFVFILTFSLFFSYVANLFIPYFLGEKFIQSSQYVIYFAFAFAFNGMYLMITNYIFYEKKTHILASLTFFTAILHMVLLYLLINLNGAIGAGQATLISFIISFILSWILSGRVYSMPWNIWRKNR